jgi:hypothetical protein
MQSHIHAQSGVRDTHHQYQQRKQQREWRFGCWCCGVHGAMLTLVAILARSAVAMFDSALILEAE